MINKIRVFLKTAIVIAIALAFVLPGLSVTPDTHASQSPQHNPQSITVTQAKEMMDTDHSVIVLDVREFDEYASGHIPNAILFPAIDLGCSLCYQKTLGKQENNSIIVYCNNGSLSEWARSILMENGFNYVYDLNGGLTAWTDANFTINKTIPVDVFYENIDKDLNADQPVFLFFYADWCGYCKQQKPIIAELKKEHGDKAMFIDINVEINRHLAEEFEVTGYPTTFLIIDKDETGYIGKRFTGLTDNDTFEDAFRRC